MSSYKLIKQPLTLYNYAFNKISNSLSEHIIHFIERDYDSTIVAKVSGV